MPPSETGRVKLVQNAFAQSIANVSKPVNAQTLAEVFPYADEKMLEALAIQTKNLVTHYANGRWKEFAEAASFEELCEQFNHLEREAIERIQAGIDDIYINFEIEESPGPQIVDPPTPPQTTGQLETLYQSANEHQLQANESVHTQIRKQINEIERLEANIKNRSEQIQSTAEEWGKVLP
ncbi:hypothetical protein H4Q26_001839 [Puccinia striiformis f. sp. tritici PST-130]|nr:hypothetical protein H4Q26_001839 [Puccinia striiformis f. sp. tritici PST-130]